MLINNHVPLPSLDLVPSALIPAIRSLIGPHLPPAPPAQVNALDGDADAATLTNIGSSIKISKLERLAQEGALGKAARLIESSLDSVGLAPLNDDTRAKLVSLFPPSDAHADSIPIATTRVHIPDIKLTIPDLDAAVYNLDWHSANGCSAWTNALIKCLWNLDRDIDLPQLELYRNGVLTLLTLILNGKGGNSSYWCASRVIPLVKRGGGIRPLAIGESWIRLAGRIASKIAVPVVTPHLLPLQVGIGVPGGTEMVAHISNTITAKWNDQSHGLTAAASKYGIATLDIKNAFNSMRRAPIYDSLMELHQPLIPFFRWSYGSPSPLVLSDGSCFGYSSTGVRQGDPLGPLLFAIGLHPVLKLLQEHFPNHLFLAYLDDISILGDVSPERMVPIMNLAKQLLNNIGLHINEDKSDVWIPGRDANKNGLTVVGASVGTYQYQMLSLSQKLLAYDSILNQLSSLPLPPQLAFALLGSCVHSRPMYMARVTPPCIVPDNEPNPFARFDHKVLETLMAISKVDIATPEIHASLIASLPIRLGGLGLRKMAQVHSCAWTASYLRAAKFLKTHLLAWVPAPLEQMTIFAPFLHTIHLHCADLVVLEEVNNAALPQPTLTLWSPTDDIPDSNIPKQKQLVSAIDNINMQQLTQLISGTPDIKAWILSNQFRGSGSWLYSATCSASVLQVCNDDFTRSIGLRLLLPQYLPGWNHLNYYPSQCYECTAMLPNQATQTTHCLNCNKRQGIWKSRHDAVRDCLLDTLSTLYGKDNITKEVPIQLDDGSPGIVADLVLRSAPAQELWIDVAISSASSPKYITHGSDVTPLAAASNKESQKTGKYRPYLVGLNRNADSFIPFVIETSGQFGKAATQFFQKLLQNKPGTQETLQFCMRRIQAIIARYNAKLAAQISINVFPMPASAGVQVG
jgi:hypothetical protein